MASEDKLIHKERQDGDFSLDWRWKAFYLALILMYFGGIALFAYWGP